jgi:hypothetical protein
VASRQLAAIIVLSLVCSFGSAEEPEDVIPQSRTVPSYESYEGQLLVGVVERRAVDLNEDGARDYMVFSNGGEETFLDLLLTSSSGFVVWGMPVAQDYELLESAEGPVVRLKFDTYPVFGTLWKSDLHGWYDHYRIRGLNLELHNQGYEQFYRKQRQLYQERIAELEGLMATVESQCGTPAQDNASANDLEEYRETCVWMKESNYTAQIEKYRKFIRKADELLNGTGA